jgi:hypothetical protein
MKLKPYKEILKMAKEAVDECLAPVRAMRAKKQAELEVAKMDEKIATHEAKIQEICTEKDINFDKLISAQDELALMERRKKQFAKIIEELFPED